MPITLPPLPEDTVTRQKLGEYWLHNALMEHAAIAAFARLSLELLSLGAPPDLLRQSASAQTDEIHHAEICFSLASHYLGEDISPGAYPGIISGGLRRVRLAELTRESFVDGAIGEGIACRVAEGQSELAKDEKLSTIYATIARDEGRHAKLGWDIVEWALTTEDEKEKKKIEKTLHDALSKTRLTYHLKTLTTEERAYFDPSLSDHGLMSETRYLDIRKLVYEESLERLDKMIGKREEGKGWWKVF